MPMTKVFSIQYRYKTETTWTILGLTYVPTPAYDYKNYYLTGKMAAQAKDALTARHPDHTFRITPVDVDLPADIDNWKERERGRFEDGTYVPLPWAEEDWFKGPHEALNHFCHVSKTDPNRVSYTENAAKGREDRQSSPMNIGRYLTEFYKLTPERVAELVRQFVKIDAELKFAKTADEIEYVYLNGPNSCMSKDLTHYSGHCHPVRAYGDSDFQVAYIERDGRVTARALIHGKLYSTIYGDFDRLSDSLGYLGYSREHDEFEGLRLRAIPDEKQGFPYYVLPFMDNHSRANLQGDYFVLDCNGTTSCGSTAGSSQWVPKEITCECGEHTYAPKLNKTKKVYECRACYQKHTCRCSGCSEDVERDDTYDVMCYLSGSPSRWCRSCTSTYTWLGADFNLYSTMVSQSPYLTTEGFLVPADHVRSGVYTITADRQLVLAEVAHAEAA